MEKFFRVEVGSRVDIAYHRWNHETQKIAEVVREFFKEKEIESPSYNYGKNGICGTHATQGDEDNIQLGLVPTENDLKNFGTQICKQEKSYAIRYLKKTSVLRKEFAQRAIENSLCKLEKPSAGGWAGFYSYIPPCRTRLFEYKGVLYGSIEATEVGNSLIEGIIEISGVNFYKVIEAIEAEEDGGTDNGTN